MRKVLWTIVPLILLAMCPTALASDADLHIPDLNTYRFIGIGGKWLLMAGLLVCIAGLAFGLVIYSRLKNLPVHKSMLEVSELIYATCKTYLTRQLLFILVLEIFIGAVLVVYFGFLATDQQGQHMPPPKVATVIAFSLVGIFGSYGVSWFGIRINTFANSRAAMGSLAGKPFPVYAIPLQAGISIGMVLISVELFIMLCILLFVPGDYAGPCFIGFAVGESLGAAALRVAGGIFTKIADIGADLMKIVFDVKEDDARNPGVIADCVGDNAGDSVGPTADGFETYGVTGVALITFILLAMPSSGNVQATLLVWIFVMRLVMVLTSGGSYFINEFLARKKYQNADEMDFEHPLTSLVILTSVLSVITTYVASFLLIHKLGDGSLWWKLSTIISCGTAAGALIPEFTKVFTSVKSRHVREIVDASREGGAPLTILSGLTAGNFGAYWLGLVITILMATAYGVCSIGADSGHGVAQLMTLNTQPAVAVFAFGLVAFGFLGMGPVTIAVDSYGPVTDNAQSVYELSLIEKVPNIEAELQRDFGVTPNFERAKLLLEENDGAGNTFKATAKPVLIGTAVVGATTMIFSIIMVLTNSMADVNAFRYLSILHAPFLLGLVMGGAVIYWFTGASMQAVATGAYRAVEFIKKNMKLDSTSTRANIEDSKKVVAICTKYAQAGMLNIFLVVFFTTLSFACLEPFFFIGFLIGLAIFGLFQAIFMANAGGAWDNAKKIVETELREKGTDLHKATVVGDTVGDPFKDTSSVAMNPIIKFTTLFGLLAVELAQHLRDTKHELMTHCLSAGFFVIAVAFVYRSFYGMRIKSGDPAAV